MAVEPDDVPGLLAAEEAALAPERLEHVAVADVGRDHADAVLAPSACGSRGSSSPSRRRGRRRRWSASTARIWSPSIALPLASTASIAVAVAVERDAEVEPAARDRLLQGAEIGRAVADVDVRAVRLVADREHVRAELLEGLRREVARTRRSRSRRRSSGRRGRSRSARARARGSCRSRCRRGRSSRRSSPARVEERLDLLLLRVDELLPVAVEELDAVVLGRVVRRGDDDAEVEPRAARPRASAAPRRAPRGRPRRRHRARTHPRAPRLTLACHARRRRALRRRPRGSTPCPRRSTSSSVRNSPTTPRTPSVPKYRLPQRADGNGSTRRRGFAAP